MDAHAEKDQKKKSRRKLKYNIIIILVGLPGFFLLAYCLETIYQNWHASQLYAHLPVCQSLSAEPDSSCILYEDAIISNYSSSLQRSFETYTFTAGGENGRNYEVEIQNIALPGLLADGRHITIGIWGSVVTQVTVSNQTVPTQEYPTTKVENSVLYAILAVVWIVPVTLLFVHYNFPGTLAERILVYVVVAPLMLLRPLYAADVKLREKIKALTFPTLRRPKRKHK